MQKIEKIGALTALFILMISLAGCEFNNFGSVIKEQITLSSGFDNVDITLSNLEIELKKETLHGQQIEYTELSFRAENNHKTTQDEEGNFQYGGDQRLWINSGKTVLTGSKAVEINPENGTITGDYADTSSNLTEGDRDKIAMEFTYTESVETIQEIVLGISVENIEKDIPVEFEVIISFYGKEGWGFTEVKEIS